MSQTPEEAVRSGKENVKRTAQEASSTLQHEAERARQAGRSYARDVRHEAASRAESGKNQMAEEVSRLAGALHDAADNLEEGSIQSHLLHRAAAGVDEAAANLKDRSLGEMVSSLSQYGRRNPATFIGGAAVLGFAMARFAAASGTSRPSHAGHGRKASDFDAYEAGRSARPTPSPGNSSPQKAGVTSSAAPSSGPTSTPAGKATGAATSTSSKGGASI